MVDRRGPRRDLNADERAALAELGDDAWRTSRDFAPRSRRWVIGVALTMLLRRGLVEREALVVPHWYAIHRWRYRITDTGRAELASPDRADG